MKFQVPQFIETETKVIGPFTLKQFLWVAGGLAIIFFSFLVFPTPVFVVVAFVAGSFFGALAFIKLDGVPLFNYLVYLLGYALNPRKYFFKKTEEGLSTEDIKENFMPKKKEPKREFLKLNPTEEDIMGSENDSAKDGGSKFVISDEIVVSSPDKDEEELLKREQQEKALAQMRNN